MKKLWVITKDDGTVAGTFRAEEGKSHGGPIMGRPTPIAGQIVHEVEISDDIHAIRNAEELHKAVAKHLKHKK